MPNFRPLLSCVLHQIRKPHIWNVSLSQNATKISNLEICHITSEIWEPQEVDVSNHLIEYQGNRWWNVLAKAGEDGQTDGRTVCRSEEWHTQHTITPNKWPKHKRKNLRKIRNGAWAYIVLRRCQTNVLSSYVYQENVIFKWSIKKGNFFAFKDVFNLNVHFFHS